MARLASDAKLGYYPTSKRTIKKVIDKTILFPEKQSFMLDACAGDGEAIEYLGTLTNSKTYAVELENKRAKEASARNISTVLNGDALSGVRKSNNWVGLNFLNPPYGEHNGKRLEIEFVNRWGVATVFGGALVLVINQSSATEKLAKILREQGYKPVASFYDENNEDHKKYGQFFIVLQRRIPNFRTPITNFMSIFENPINIDSDVDVEKIAIKTGFTPSCFKEIVTPRWKLEKKLDKSKLRKIFFDDLKQASMANRSIAHPNEGQAAILIASGALNKAMTLKDGTRIILKGTTKKEKNESGTKTDVEGNVTAVRLTDHYITEVIGLSITNGQFIKYK